MYDIYYDREAIELKKYFVLILLGLVLLPDNISAAMCSNEEKLKLKEMARNIVTDYEYVEEDDGIKFTIKFSNIPEHFVIHDNLTGYEYVDQGSELSIPVDKINKTYKFFVYDETIGCHLERLANLYVTIPGYNKYYKDDLCKGIEDYKLCYKWLNVTMSYDEWKAEINKYLEKKNKKEEVKVVVEKSFLEKVFDFISAYYLIIIPGVIVLLLLIRKLIC